MEREEAIKICKDVRKNLCAIRANKTIHEALTTAIIDMEMMPRVLNALNIVRNTVENASQEHPYKEIGNRESYSEYNEGWSDACARIEIVLDTLLSNEPVVTLEDISNAYENGYAQGKFEAQKKNDWKRYGRTGYRLNGEDMKKCKDCEYSWQLTEKVYVCTNDVYDIINKSCYVENTVCGSQQSHCESDSTTALNSAFDSQSRVL